MRWRSWLRHCATSRMVGGSIPDGVTGIFYWHNPSGRTMVLGLTQPPTEVSTRNIYIYIYIYIYTHTHTHTHTHTQGGADKSLARLTSRCRGTESIVSLERVVCTCAQLQVFSCYRGWEKACQATRAISTTSRCDLSSSFFFPARQGAEGNSRHSDRNIRGTCTIVCHRQKLGGPV